MTSKTPWAINTPEKPCATPARVPTREAHIERYLINRVKELGGECRKVAWIGRNSAPDRLVMLPTAPQFSIADLCRWFHVPFNVAEEAMRDAPELPGRAIWVELKAPGKAATFPANAHEKAQYREHERMRKMGQRVEVVDSYERIDEILR